MTAPDLPAEKRDALAEVLAGHRLPYGGGVCTCGWVMTLQHFGEWSEAHAAHVRDALAPLVAGWLTGAKAEALREAADAGPHTTATDGLWRMWLRDRADRIAGG